MTELSVAVGERGSATVLEPAGKILLDTREPLDLALKQAAGGTAPHIVIDMGAVTVCDSSGLQLLVGMSRQVATAGGWLRLARPRPLVRRVLEITNLIEVLGVYDSVESALAGPPSVSDGEAPGRCNRPGPDHSQA